MSSKHRQAPVGVLLANIGTPNAPTVGSVRRYLREFLMDSRVLDINWVYRFLLVQGVIAPRRGVSSAREYRQLWTEKGSPLQYHSASLCEKLQDQLGDRYIVRYAMRYQRPALDKVLAELRSQPLSALILFPLFPQYASASTGSLISRVSKILQGWQIIPDLMVCSQFHLKKEFLNAWVQQAEPFLKQNDWDTYLFSYHGLPERQIRKGSIKGHCKLNKCCETAHPANQHCYRAQCFQTTKALIEALNLPKERCHTAFQSRLGNVPWLQPYLDDTIQRLPKGGTRSLLVFSPSFVADCLETNFELGKTYKARFLAEGGKKFALIPSLNDSSLWVKALQTWIEQLADRTRAPHP